MWGGVYCMTVTDQSSGDGDALALATCDRISTAPLAERRHIPVGAPSLDRERLGQKWCLGLDKHT